MPAVHDDVMPIDKVDPKKDGDDTAHGTIKKPAGQK